MISVAWERGFQFHYISRGKKERAQSDNRDEKVL